MKLVGFTGYDFNVNQLESLGATITHLGKVQSSLIATPYKAYIEYGSYDETRYRPYLVLDTEIQGAIGDFSNGITEFRYRDEDKLLRSVNYHFTDDELGVLASKGLYNPNFEIPELFTDTDFEIPIDLDIYLVNMNDKTMVYASYDMISDLQTDSKHSGYDLAQYFEKQVQDTYDIEHELYHEDEYSYEPNYDYQEEASNDLELNQGDYELIPDTSVSKHEEEQEVTPIIDDQDVAKIDLDKIIADSYRVKSAVEEFGSVDLNETLDSFKQLTGEDREAVEDEETIVEKHERENETNVEDVTKDLDKGRFDTESMRHGFSLSPDIEHDEPQY